MAALPLLSTYVENVCSTQGLPIDPNHRPFNHGTAVKPPLLRRRGITRILLYSGCFNPPHQGHFDLLHHIFHNAGDDLHIAAAIILPIDDVTIAPKKDKGRRFALSLEKRVKLWRSSAKMDWVWVFDHGIDALHALQEQLHKDVEAAGMEIKFIKAFGPDWVGPESIYKPVHAWCRGGITSDISRLTNFRTPTSMLKLYGCSDWVKLDLDWERLERVVRAKMAGKTKKEVDLEIAASFSRTQNALVCHTLFKPKYTIRFVPTDLNQRPTIAPSSTALRNIIRHSSEKSLLEDLSTMALSPVLLEKYVREWRHSAREDDADDDVEEVSDDFVFW